MNTDIISHLREQGVKGAPLTHSQNVMQSVVGTGVKCQVSYDVKDKHDVVLNFVMKRSFPLADIINKITLPTNCVKAAHATVVGNSVRITATIPLADSAASKDRDRDVSSVKKYKFLNEINDVFEHMGLNEKDLKAAQIVQKYMINAHALQPLVSFSVTEKGPDDTFLVHAENIDMVDLFFIHQLMKDCPEVKEIEFVIPDTTPSTVPIFELQFTIKKNTGEEKPPERKKWGIF